MAGVKSGKQVGPKERKYLIDKPINIHHQKEAPFSFHWALAAEPGS
jgi:hypothetical protein